MSGAVDHTHFICLYVYKGGYPADVQTWMSVFLKDQLQKKRNNERIPPMTQLKS